MRLKQKRKRRKEGCSSKVKEGMEATTAKEGNLGKGGKKMDSGSFLKAEPTKEEMHAVTIRFLKQVDFNTTRLSDIKEHLCFHFGVDLMHREAEMMNIITDVINNMNDEEDEVDEAEESTEASDDAKKDEDGDAENDEDDDDGGKIEMPAKRKRSDDSDNDEDQEDDDNMQEVVQSDGGPLVQSVDDDDDEDVDDEDDDDEEDDDDDAVEADEEDMGTEYLIKSVSYAEDEEDACVFEPEKNGEIEEWRAEMKEEINEDLDLPNKGSILKFGEEKEVEDDDERYANGDFYEGPWERNLQDGQRRYVWKNENCICLVTQTVAWSAPGGGGTDSL